MELRFARTFAPLKQRYIDEIRRRDLREMLDAVAERGTRAEAEEKYEEMQSLTPPEFAVRQLSLLLGIDLAKNAIELVFVQLDPGAVDDILPAHQLFVEERLGLGGGLAERLDADRDHTLTDRLVVADDVDKRIAQ